MDVSISLFGNLDAQLDAFADAIRERAVRPAARQAALVVYEEAKVRAPEYKGPPKKGIKPGQLKAAIYHVFSPESSTDSLKVYRVGWNHAKAPHGHWMEFGNARHPAHPFIRPAFDATIVQALERGRDRAGEIVREIIAGAKA